MDRAFNPQVELCEQHVAKQTEDLRKENTYLTHPEVEKPAHRRAVISLEDVRRETSLVVILLDKDVKDRWDVNNNAGQRAKGF